ncbi:MAG: cyclic nucleotide-binding domain-containing protein [Gammaproteobacteria bacterium]|nr:cyclic nucleotide-binding domain-containing protein [Gammaproteobacteria bacterium]
MSGINNLLDYSPTTLSRNITDFLTNYGRKKNYSKGQVLANEGEMSSNVFILLEGEAEILKQDGSGNFNVIARVGQGTILGEMGVFLDQKRTGTIRAASELICLEFTNENFLNALKRIPELSFRMFKSLSTKIANSNETMVTQCSNQNLLTVGIALLDLKPAKVTNNLGQVTVHPSQLSDETGIERKIIRAVIEQFKNKRMVTASSVTYDGSMLLTVDFSRLSKFLKALVNKDGKIQEDATPTVKKTIDKPQAGKSRSQYELALKKGLAYQ